MADSLIDILPLDYAAGNFLGRALSPDGPCVIAIRDGALFDLTEDVATVSGAVDRRAFNGGRLLGPVENGLPANWQLLAPTDLQCIKACGVTFAVSAIERVIEERARGDADKAAEIRDMLEDAIGAGIRSVIPGSAEASTLKATLIDADMWSQYLEVAIGPDAEVFSKSPVLSAVGHGAEIGVRSDSTWNNPEPEIVLIVDPRGEAVGATLGNDVNLRDFEGRSALLLSKAKDNNASCALGPFIRLLDDDFTLASIGQLEVSLDVQGPDGFHMQGVSAMSAISRTPRDLADQLLNRCHQYPDGVVLFLGTMFSPTQDRRGAGQGFTHEVGDRVSISAPQLGCLINEVDTSDACPEWTFGVGALMRNLVKRGVLTPMT